jgi:hypothetical protein
VKLAVLLSLLLMLGGANVLAQDSSCPVGLVCVQYEDYILDIDPACGVVQAIVTEENLARTTNLEGVTEGYGLRGVVVALDSGIYKVIGEFSGPAKESLSGVRFGDVGCLDWEVEIDSE